MLSLIPLLMTSASPHPPPLPIPHPLPKSTESLWLALADKGVSLKALLAQLAFFVDKGAMAVEVCESMAMASQSESAVSAPHQVHTYDFSTADSSAVRGRCLC